MASYTERIHVLVTPAQHARLRALSRRHRRSVTALVRDAVTCADYAVSPGFPKAVDIVEKTIGAFEVRRQFGKMLTDILTRGDRFVVERHGEPVAVVVPIPVYEQWKQAREPFFDEMEAAAAQANLTPEAAAALADEAIRDVRDGR